MTRKHVHAELPEGTALQDAAAAVAVYEKAVRSERGETIDLGP